MTQPRLTKKDIWYLARISGKKADISDPRAGKLELAGYMRETMSYDPKHYDGNFAHPVMVYTLTEKGATVVANEFGPSVEFVEDDND